MKRLEQKGLKKIGLVIAAILAVGISAALYIEKESLFSPVEKTYSSAEPVENNEEGEITGHDDESFEEAEEYVYGEDGKFELSHELLELSREYHDKEYIFVEPRLENLGYKIKKGDTLSVIAQRFNTTSDYLLANNLDIDLRTLQVGKEIKIPNENGIFYKIEKNDSFSSLEKVFSVSPDIIKEDNNIQELRHGEVIFVREPTLASEFKKRIKSIAAAQKRAASVFTSPLNRLVITSKFGSRKHPVLKKTIHHAGVDLKAPIGTRVLASKPGVVTFAGYSGAYGHLVVVSHPDGYETRYAHLSKINVKKGQKVNGRQIIALSGNSGRSTGPHLHFEVRKNGRAQNPISHIRG